VFLALDLLTGRVARGHPLHAWLLAQGIDEVDLEAFRVDPLTLDLVGINLYPMFSLKRVQRSRGSLRVRQVAAGPEIVERLAVLYHRRYGRPVFVTETAALGSHERRRLWMAASVGGVRSARERGVPVIGYTWWPLFALVAWAYRQRSTRTLEAYLLQMGLWDLEPRDLARVRTPLVDVYRDLVSGGSLAVGRLAAAPLG
jgi:hypothetical protein